MKFKKGDNVIVTAGKDKGRKGKIEKVFPKQNKVLISGINVYKKHVKPRGEGQPGGIVDVVKPLLVSNVAFLCSKCGQQTRIGYKINEKSDSSRRKAGLPRQQTGKFRICRKCQAVIK